MLPVLADLPLLEVHPVGADSTGRGGSVFLLQERRCGRGTCKSGNGSLPCLELVFPEHDIPDLMQGHVLGLVELDDGVLVNAPIQRHLGTRYPGAAAGVLVVFANKRRLEIVTDVRKPLSIIRPGWNRHRTTRGKEPTRPNNLQKKRSTNMDSKRADIQRSYIEQKRNAGVLQGKARRQFVTSTTEPAPASQSPLSPNFFFSLYREQRPLRRASLGRREDDTV